MTKSNIPIQNIYYMLSYAYERLKINETIFRQSVDFENIYDLFAKILENILNKLIKRGFYKDYILINEDVSSPKGKINISESIKKQTLLNKKVNCQFDEFSENVLFNQIIKTTIENLIRIDALDKKLKKKLKKFKPFFSNVDTIELNKHVFKTLIWNKNNNYYNVAISICELIYLYQLPDDHLDGKIAFKDFIQNYEKEFARLYEDFILNFYKKELKSVKVHAPHIPWDLDETHSNIGVNYLPNMRSDIVLENKENQLIIDAKFYKNILSSFYDVEKLNSGNIYQILSYVNNSNFKGNVKGMLLYASLGEDIDYEYKINGHIIYIKTLDLNKNWKEIEKRLKDIAELIN